MSSYLALKLGYLYKTNTKTLYFNFAWLLQKRFLLFISRNTQNNNNLTRIIWNKRLITRFLRQQEINFRTLYSNNSKKIRLKILLVNEGKLFFFIFFLFFILCTMFYLTLSLLIFIFLLLHNFINFPPQFFIPSSTLLIFSLLLNYFKLFYYLFKIFPQFWLAKSTRIIHHNQLLMTKFGRILYLTRKWRQKCSVLAG